MDEEVINQVIELLNRKDERALTILMESASPKLIQYAFKLVRNVLDAEEIVNDAITKLWYKWDINKPVINISAFLYIMIRNAAFDLRERRKTEKKRMLLFGSNQETSTSLSLPTVDVSKIPSRFAFEEKGLDYLIDKILTDLSRMGELRIKIFELKFTYDLTNKEIATILNISEIQVKNQLQHGVSLIRTKLERADLVNLVLGLKKIWFLPYPFYLFCSHICKHLT